MKDGKYIDMNGRIAWVYHNDVGLAGECCVCGKIRKDPISLVWDDDEQGIEYLYGSECIKRLKLHKA